MGTIMDTFLERMDTVRPKKAMYFGDVSLITSSNVGLEPKRSTMNLSITVEYIIMILQMQMYLTFSEIQWGFPVFFSKIQAKFEIHKPFSFATYSCIGAKDTWIKNPYLSARFK